MAAFSTMRPSTRERAARILAKAQLLPENRSKADQIVATEENVSVRAIRNWRAELKTDEELARLFQVELDAYKRTSVEDFEEAKKELLKLVLESAKAVNPKNPRSLMARTKALNAVAEAQRSEKVLNVWVNNFGAIDQPAPEAAESFAPRVTFEFEDTAEPAEDDQIPVVEPAPEKGVASG